MGHLAVVKVLFSPLDSGCLGPELPYTLPSKAFAYESFAKILGFNHPQTRMSMSTSLGHPKGHFSLLRISSWMLLGRIHPLIVK